jgi:hypothetical protein
MQGEKLQQLRNYADGKLRPVELKLVAKASNLQAEVHQTCVSRQPDHRVQCFC